MTIRTRRSQPLMSDSHLEYPDPDHRFELGLSVPYQPLPVSFPIEKERSNRGGPVPLGYPGH